MSGSNRQAPSPDMTSPQAASDSVQHFLGVMEDELFSYLGAGNSPISRRREDPGVDEKAAGIKREDSEEKERKMREVMEKVERVVCSLFYEKYTFRHIRKQIF